MQIWQCNKCLAEVKIASGTTTPAAHDPPACDGSWRYIGSDGVDAQAVLDAADSEAHARWADQFAEADRWYAAASDLAIAARAMSVAAKALVDAAGSDRQRLRQAAGMMIGILDNEASLCNVATVAANHARELQRAEPPMPGANGAAARS